MNNNTSEELTVIAVFKLKTGTREKFIAFAQNDSESSLMYEEGCKVFDILIPEEDSSYVVLYEVYSDRAAFDNHKNMPHYFPFIEGTAPLLIGEPDVYILKNLRKHPHNSSWQ
jgi:quinol monooxygenase YgiN